MRILDEQGMEILHADESEGYTTQDKIFIMHHDAVPGRGEQGHYETIAEYPNGGKDIEWIVDSPAVPETEAWDEYEEILRWHRYTAEELEAMNLPTVEDRIAALEGQNAMLLEALLEMSAEIYN